MILTTLCQKNVAHRLELVSGSDPQGVAMDV